MGLHPGKRDLSFLTLKITDLKKKNSIVHVHLFCRHLGAASVQRDAPLSLRRLLFPCLAMHDFIGSESSSPKDLILAKERKFSDWIEANWEIRFHGWLTGALIGPTHDCMRVKNKPQVIHWFSNCQPALQHVEHSSGAKFEALWLAVKQFWAAVWQFHCWDHELTTDSVELKSC